MSPRHLLPHSIMGRLALILVAALCLEFAINAAINKWQERGLLSVEQSHRIAEQLASADQIVMQFDAARRPEIARKLAINGMTMNWVPATIITDSSAVQPQLDEMRARLAADRPRLSGRDLRLNLIRADSESAQDLLGALRLSDGSFLTFRVRPFVGAPPPWWVTASLHLLLVVGLIAATLLATRAMVRPLSNLAEAADNTGRGLLPEIRVEGPEEVRRVATAFRAMQQRLLQMIEDHAQALVAVSHDLRTPIQRMRLRIGSFPDESTREGMSADLADMEKFIASVSSFLKDGAEEPEKLVDLAAIVMTLVDNTADAGADIAYDGPDELAVRLKPAAMKRALGNLVDNARAHADKVRVTLHVTPGEGERIVLTVEDDGPGIPASRREEVFLPFRRLDSGRSKGGSGLGLAIVRKAVASLGGAVSLTDSAMGGLCARIELPLELPR
ncbi:MAG: ATP-binding protein [Novosphingobium sp.]|nr:ATP-binding protein [Novosphingobium sp.]